jgi:hypothetical protein
VVVATDDSGTCWASRRRVEPISLSARTQDGHPPLPRGQKSRARGQVARADRKAARPPLGGVSTGVRRSRALTTNGPCLEAEKRLHEREMREAESPHVPSPPHRKTQT